MYTFCVMYTSQAYIRVIDINQYRPQFLKHQYEAYIPEDTPPGTEIISVSATDNDQGKGLIYTLDSSLDLRSMKLFQMDPSRGTLRTVMRLSSQSMLLHTLTVMVCEMHVFISLLLNCSRSRGGVSLSAL